MEAMVSSASSDAEPPLSVYRRRNEAQRALVSRLERRDAAIAWGRVVMFVAAAVLAVFALRGAAPVSLLLVPGGIFLALVITHDGVIGRRERAGAAIELCAAGIDRIEDRWAGKGDPGRPFQDAADAHLYAADLDLFGEGGLFELVSSARTPIGQSTLAGWLQAPAEAAVCRARQAAVAELAERFDLRLDLALGSRVVAEKVKQASLLHWAATAPAGLPARLGPWRVVLAAAALVTLGTAVLWAAGVLGPWPFVAAFVAGWLLSRRLSRPVAEIARGIDHRADELRAVADILARLEREHFRAESLQALRRTVDTGGVAPSRRVAELHRLVGLLEGRRNQLAALLMVPLQATAQLALAVEAWRRAFGPAVIRWMSAVGDLEALSSLATFRFEHPEYPFPTIVEAPRAAASEPETGGADAGRGRGAALDEGTAPVFDAEALGHPLIPAARRVCNDLRVGGLRRLILVSGSNMSGKSTLLRTVGINAALALAGAPVCARRLTLSPLTIGATLRINDSLQAGKSRFYAELTRLKQIVDAAAGSPPLLFLLDEILHGTNSHDRRIGAEAIIGGLIARGAVGLVTTHDLALAEVAEALGPRATNVHFEDHLEDGVMTFDYRVKPGIVRKSNALELMRAVGLEV